MRSKDENALLRGRLKTLYEASYRLFEPLSVWDAGEYQHVQSHPKSEHHHQRPNKFVQPPDNFPWHIISYGAGSAGGILLGGSISFYTAGMIAGCHWSLAVGLILFVISVLALDQQRRNAKADHRMQTIQTIVDKFMGISPESRSTNVDRINGLVASGIATLEANKEMLAVFSKLEKYGVEWPDLSAYDAKQFFDRLAATGTRLKHDADVPSFILREFYADAKIPSSTPEEKVAQARDQAH